MKKLKYLPTLLMAFLCVGVLAFGIYAITPTENTISGQITINASNDEIAIVGYVDDVEVFRADSVRSGVSLSIPKDKLAFKTDTANTLEDLGSKTLRINIKNKSSNGLGVYFYNGVELPEDGYATEEHITTLSQVKSGTKLVASMYMDSYSYLAPNDDESETNTTYDQIDMHVEIFPETFADSTDDLSADFSLALNIEDYVATENLMDNIVSAATPTSVGSPNVSGLVKFPETETEFAARAFANNQNIDYACFPSSYSTLALNTFYYSSLKGVFLPDSMKTFANQIFVGCSNLVSVTLPNNLLTISKNMFRECKSLKYVRLPLSLQTIGYGAFWLCDSLYQMDIPADVLAINEYAFLYCKNLKIVNFNNKLETIGEQAFAYTNIEEVSLPASITSVGMAAFGDCSNLKKVIFPEVEDHVDPVKIKDAAFSGTSLCDDVYLPNNYVLEATSETSPSNGPFAASKISNFVVNEDNDLYMTIDGVLYRRSSADSTVPDRLEAYPSHSANQTITIPASVTQIRRYELVNAKYLTYINVASENTVFASADGILYDKNDSDGDGVYDGMLTIPPSYTVNNMLVKDIVIPYGVKVLGGSYDPTATPTDVVYGWGLLGSTRAEVKLTIPTSVISIAGCAFQIADNLVSINSDTAGTFDLSGLNLGLIGYKSFEYCTMKELIIDKYMNGEEEQAMSWGEGFVLYAKNLTSITFAGTETPTIEYAYRGYSSTLAGNFENLAEGFVLKVPTGCKDTFINDWTAHINANTNLTSAVLTANLTALENFASQIEEYAVA